MSARLKHPKPEGEDLLKAAEQQKWRVVVRVIGVQILGVIVDMNDQPVPADVIDHLTDALMEELLELPDAIDPDVGATLSTGQVRISMHVKAEHIGEAADTAQVLVEKAMQGAGISVEWKKRPREPQHWEFEDQDWDFETKSKRLVET